MSILYAAAFAPLTTVVIDRGKSDSVCTYGNCEKPLLIVAIGVIAVSLIIVLTSYIIVLLNMKSIAYREKMRNEPEVTRKKMYRFFYFGGHLALYVIVSTLVLAGAAVIFHNVYLYNKIRKSMREDCDIIGQRGEDLLFQQRGEYKKQREEKKGERKLLMPKLRQRYIDTLIRLETLAGGVVLLWLVRIVFDVVIVLLTDYSRLLPWIAGNDLQPLRDNQVCAVCFPS
ncbi:hypothetical protein GCK32_017632 [Trichostrongylus colubriformis]|uniref:Uncharacterized protein n=1 Tax=Trichostrongylus colubriformis TaxID=6319 RepID=A0AAN8F3M6_TRICO